MKNIKSTERKDTAIPGDEQKPAKKGRRKAKVSGFPILKKHVAMVHISNELTFVQRKAANALLLNAYADLLTKETHQITVRDLANLIGFDSNNLEVLKDQLRALAKTVVEWNIIEEGGEKTKTWGVGALVAAVEIDGGNCYYNYSELLRNRLYNPDVFAGLSLEIQNRLSTKGALALYENIERYKDIGITGWWTVDMARKLVGAHLQESYQDWRKFKQRVLNPAIEEINKVTDIQVEMETKTVGRKVISLRFHIGKNPQNNLDLRSLLEPPVNEVLCTLLESEYGFTKAQAIDAVRSYSEDYIKSKIELLHKEAEKKEIRSSAAWLISALQRDFQTKDTFLDKKKQEKIEQTTRSQQQTIQTAKEKAQAEATRIEDYLASLSPAAKERLDNSFAMSLPPAMSQRFREKGASAGTLKSLFMVFVAKLMK